jgi:predicted component of type VI protein secretion system
MSGEPCWGTLRLHSWIVAEQQQPLAPESKRKVSLAGADELVVGRMRSAVLRLSKALLWVSNKHFSLCRDEQGRVALRDCSSNGTWVNNERVSKGEGGHTLASGDLIQIAAEDGEEHRQVVFLFEASTMASPTAAAIAGGKRQRLVAPPSQRADCGGAMRPPHHVATPTAVVAASDAVMPDADYVPRAERDAVVVLLRQEIEHAEQAVQQRDDAWRHQQAQADEALEGECERLMQREREAQEQLQCVLREQDAHIAARRAAEEEARRQAEVVDSTRRRLEEVERTLQEERARANAVAEEAQRNSREIQRLRSAMLEVRATVSDAMAAAGDAGECDTRHPADQRMAEACADGDDGEA